MLIPDQPLIRNHFYLITWYHAVIALTPQRLRTSGYMPRGRARGQNLENLRFFFLVWNYSYVNNSYYLGLTLSVTSNLRVYCPGMGQGVKNLGHL